MAQEMDVDLKTLTEKVLGHMGLNSEQQHIVFDLLVHTARFCFAKGFSRTQIETLCDVVGAVLRDDIQQWQRGPNASFKDLQEQLLLNSAERIPTSRGIFSPVQVVTAVDFLLRVYYARFTLYKHSLSAVPDPLLDKAGLHQDNVAGVEEFVPMPPLSEAILIELLDLEVEAQRARMGGSPQRPGREAAGQG